MNMKSNTKLLRAADKLLRLKGFRRDGRPQKEISYEQLTFERSIIRVPTGGKLKR